MTITTIGIAILVISTLGALLWVKQSESGKHGQAKVLLFALYFWILAFIQLILVAIGYSLITS